jgi:hypothetical protein
VAGYLEELQRFVDAYERPDDALLEGLSRWDLNGATQAALSAELVFPSPLPAYWLGDAITYIDRGIRWGVAASERGLAVHEMQRRGMRPVATASGLVLVEINPGSFKLWNRASDRLYDQLQSKPVVLTLALVAGLDLVGLGPHIEFGNQPGHLPAAPVQQVNVIEDAHCTITIDVDGEQAVIRCKPLPPSKEGWRVKKVKR